MELTQLEELVAVAECGTMSAAAERLHISQPAISRSIAQLERELGQELFTRTRNRAELNEAGRVALDGARRVLAEVQALRDGIDEYAERLRTIRVASCAPAPIWEVTRRMTEARPGVILTTEQLPEREVERAIINRAVDLAVLRRPLALPTLVTRQMMTESLSVAVPADDELASREHVGWDDLNGRTFIVLGNIGFWMDVVRERLPDSQIVVQNDNVVFDQLVRTSSLLSFVTDASTGIHRGGMAGRVRVPIWGPDAAQTFFLACSADAGETARSCLDLFDDGEGAGR